MRRWERECTRWWPGRTNPLYMECCPRNSAASPERNGCSRRSPRHCRKTRRCMIRCSACACSYAWPHCMNPRCMARCHCKSAGFPRDNRVLDRTTPRHCRKRRRRKVNCQQRAGKRESIHHTNRAYRPPCRRSSAVCRPDNRLPDRRSRRRCRTGCHRNANCSAYACTYAWPRRTRRWCIRRRRCKWSCSACDRRS